MLSNLQRLSRRFWWGERNPAFKAKGKWIVRHFRESLVQTLLTGILMLVPVYLVILLLLKAMKSLAGVARPLARLLPASIPAEPAVSLLVVLVLCFLVGLALRTPFGHATRIRIENSLLNKIPGYEVFRSMTQQLAGVRQGSTWKPALAEIEEALVPAFIVEELDDGRFTVFVPSVPTPMAGTIYVLCAERVHPLNVPFTQAVKAVTNWGSGSKELVEAMERGRTPFVVK
jgi:uncharacterized membrane protein